MAENQAEGQVEMQVHEGNAHAAYANFARVTATPEEGGKKSSKVATGSDIADALVMRILVSKCHGNFIEALIDAGRPSPA